MTSPKSPAFQFYPHDFVGGRVATYTLEEIGAYSLLLAFDWSLNGLPTELEKLAKLCRVSARKFRQIWQTIGEQFPEKNGRRFNPRLELEREKQAINRAKKSKAAHSRWSADADARAMHMECSPSPSPSPIKRSVRETRALSWTARLAKVWSEQVGTVSTGHIGKMLKAAVDEHGVERVERAMRAYIVMQNADGKTLKPKWFAEQSASWIARTATPIGVVDGEPSATLELLTRPKAS